MRIVALPDLHIPYTIKLDAVESFIEVFKPTHLVYVGDMFDFPYMGRFAENNRRISEGKRVKTDYAIARALITKHKSLSKGVKIIFCAGNHEERIAYEIDRDPKLEGMWEVQENLGDLIDTYIPYGKVWSASPYLGYMHGSYCSLHHAKKTSEEFSQQSIIYGHTHDRQLFTRMNTRDTKPKPRYAQSIGCLCNLSPEWLRRKGLTNKWVNAFSVAYVWDKKFFNEYTIHIINGKFVFGGRLYE